MKIVSWNVNGLRSAYKKHFLKSFKEFNADIVCLQELRAEKKQLPEELINIDGYYSFFNPAIKRGYSGTVVYAKEKPLKIEKIIGFKRFDEEGRMIKLEYKDFTLINFYMPNGGRQKQTMDFKLKLYDYLFKYLKNSKKTILTGDFNIAHKEIDLARPKANKNKTGFTPEERKKIDELINLGFIDSFRFFNKDKKAYTFWSNFAHARERDVGWRIDYFFVSRDLISDCKSSFILKDIIGSDHYPIVLSID